MTRPVSMYVNTPDGPAIIRIAADLPDTDADGSIEVDLSDLTPRTVTNPIDEAALADLVREMTR